MTEYRCLSIDDVVALLNTGRDDVEGPPVRMEPACGVCPACLSDEPCDAEPERQLDPETVRLLHGITGGDFL